MLCYIDNPSGIAKRGEKTSFGKCFWIYQKMFCLPKQCFFKIMNKKLTKTRIAGQRQK